MTNSAQDIQEFAKLLDYYETFPDVSERELDAIERNRKPMIFSDQKPKRLKSNVPASSLHTSIISF